MNRRKQYDRHTAALIVIYGFGIPAAFAFFLASVIRLLSLQPLPALS